MRLHYTCLIYHSLYSNWEGFKDSSISADSGHERVGMMGGGGAQMSCPHQGALVYILVLKLRVSKIPTQYCVYTHWVNRSHVSECSLYKLYSGPVFPNL